MAILIYNVLNAILGLMLLILLVYVIMSWLISFNIVNTRNPGVYRLWTLLGNLVDPMLEPVRRLIPPIGGLDFSVFIVGMVIAFARNPLLLMARDTLIRLGM